MNITAQSTRDGIDLVTEQGRLTARLLAPDIVHLRYTPSHAAPSPSTMVIDPQATYPAFAAPQIQQQAEALTLASTQLRLRWNPQSRQLMLEDAQHKSLLQIDPLALTHGQLQLQHDKNDALYGIHGYDAIEQADGLLREGSHVASAGKQGFAGAPFVWSTTGYGVLADAQAAQFVLASERIDVHGKQQPITDVYLFVGRPRDIFAALAQVSGHTPMFPKWAMGFTNSQWGIDERELLDSVDTYRAKAIPIDNFTLDFDWKAWGEDHYGEFRWNASKFPDGPSGKLKSELDHRGIHLTGIMKPRIHVDTEQGRYASAHGFWLANSQTSPDYFSHQPIRELDFGRPAVRAWFFNDALKQSFTTGIVGWWNDEADESGVDSQHMNMQRALYDGQRASSNQRVWSINRNFYLGAQRYAYGLWSGDIPTSFDSMAGQRQRMLSAINLGAMQWGMDGGGFKSHPSPENYTRWIQFGAFTPIFRVHGTFNEKRQPWMYGAVAEQAATAAIRLRYALIPYIYSYEYQRHVSGIGLVRPLLFDWPNDPSVRDDSDAWMFGDYLLVAPVVQQGQTRKPIYLPAGDWIDWFSGKHYSGGQTIEYSVDAKQWRDIPLFIRAGAIIPTQSAMDYVGQHPSTEVEVEVFPSAERRAFDYYDDDGNSYAYEHGAYFRQTLAAQKHDQAIVFETTLPSGDFKPALAFYLVKIHGPVATAVANEGDPLTAFASLDALRQSSGEGWANGNDRFGTVTYLRIASGHQRRIALALK
ncbi:DUF5110 domain-containing protein [Dyella tabacisoli]|uniref:DUF5110 domain-containing protein n=2 Tax=Dyella tabacisoli TaxID=2282381 RepID=A0A369USG9_9GAMM|nr:DUF5110 domain-containing protein [Dyella tabacisoli]